MRRKLWTRILKPPEKSSPNIRNLRRFEKLHSSIHCVLMMNVGGWSNNYIQVFFSSTAAETSVGGMSGSDVKPPGPASPRCDGEPPATELTNSNRFSIWQFARVVNESIKVSLWRHQKPHSWVLAGNNEAYTCLYLTAVSTALLRPVIWLYSKCHFFKVSFFFYKESNPQVGNQIIFSLNEDFYW